LIDDRLRSINDNSWCSHYAHAPILPEKEHRSTSRTAVIDQSRLQRKAAGGEMCSP
jgi:hypothetical protein